MCISLFTAGSGLFRTALGYAFIDIYIYICAYSSVFPIPNVIIVSTVVISNDFS